MPWYSISSLLNYSLYVFQFSKRRNYGIFRSEKAVHSLEIFAFQAQLEKNEKLNASKDFVFIKIRGNLNTRIKRCSWPGLFQKQNFGKKITSHRI